MIRRVVLPLIIGGVATSWASAQNVPATMPPASPSPTVYATPQAPPKTELSDVPPPPPKPVPTSRSNDRASSAAAAQRSITRPQPLPRRTSTFQETDLYARRELLMDRGQYANPGGIGRYPEYYTANTPISQATPYPSTAARFAQGGGPDRAEQIAAYRAGQMRARNIQNNINAYGRPYGAYGAGFGFGFGLAGGLYGGYPR